MNGPLVMAQLTFSFLSSVVEHGCKSGFEVHSGISHVGPRDCSLLVGLTHFHSAYHSWQNE